MVFGDETFERKLGLNEVMRCGPRDEISALVRREKNIRELIALSLPVSLCQVRTQLKGSHLEARKRTFTRTQPCWYPDPGLPISRTVRNNTFLLLCLSVYGILQPEMTNTETTA